MNSKTVFMISAGLALAACGNSPSRTDPATEQADGEEAAAEGESSKAPAEGEKA